MSAALVEPDSKSGHPARVLAKMLIDAVDAKFREGTTYAAIAKAASMTPQQLANIKAAVRKSPAHVIDSDVAERLADAIGLKLALVAKEKP